MNNFPRKYAVLAVTLIVLVHFVSNLIWLKEGMDFYGKDVAGHLKVQTTIYYRLRGAIHGESSPALFAGRITSLLREKPLPFLGGAWTWPKLFYIYTAALNLLFGLTPLVTILSNIPALALLVASVYSIGATLGGRKTGLLAAFLVAFYPAVYGLSRKYGLDFPLAAMVALAMAVLVSCRHFDDGRKCLLLGLIVGFGILIKGQIVLFLAGPFLVSLVASFLGVRNLRGRRLLHFLAMLGISLVVSSLWWWGNVRELLGAYFGHVESELSLPLNLTFPTFSFGWSTFYLFYSIIDISPLLFIFFLLSLPVFLFSRIEQKWTMLAWIAVPYIVWTFTFQKSYLYFFPSYPAFAVITALGISKLKTRGPRLFITGVLVLGALIQFWQFSFVKVALIDLPVKKLINPNGFYSVYHPPVRNNYQEVLQGFIEEIDRQVDDTRFIRIGMLEMESSIWQENTSDTFDYYMRLKDPHFSLYRSRFTRQSFIVNCRSFTYLIVMSRDGIRETIEQTSRYYLDTPGLRSLVESIWGAPAFEEALRESGDYEVIREEVLYPDRIRLSLCRQPPLTIGAEEAFEATRFFSAKIIVHPPFVTSNRSLAYPLTIEDSDMLFPIVPATTQDGDDFVEYRLLSPHTNEVALTIEYRAPGRRALSILRDGESVVKGFSLPPSGVKESSHWRLEEIASIPFVKGETVIRIYGRDLPDLKKLTLTPR